MARNVLGAVIALLGAAAAVLSPFRAWYDGRHGQDIRIDDLFSGITGREAELFASVFLPLAFGALLTLVGVVLRSRLLVALAGVVVLGFTVLWMVRQGLELGSLTAGGPVGLGSGAALAVGGGALILLGSLLMWGRRGTPRHRRGAQPGTPTGPAEDQDTVRDRDAPGFWPRDPQAPPPAGGRDQTRDSHG
jgi:hypothetical protein